MKFPDLKVDWLRTFVAVVDTGSLSAAAPVLHRSQSAVSMQIKKLENVLGKPVLCRDRRHTEITEVGTALLYYARKMLELQAQTQSALFARRLEGRVRFGTPDDYLANYVSTVLRAFGRSHKDVQIELTCEPTCSLIPKVKRGELDLALVSRDHPSRGKLLFQEPLVWVGSPEFELWRQSPLPIASYGSEISTKKEASTLLISKRRAYRVVYRCSSAAGQVVAVENGLAVSLMTRCSVPSHLQLLQNLPKGFRLPEPGSISVAAFRSKASEQSPAVDAMYEMLVKILHK